MNKIQKVKNKKLSKSDKMKEKNTESNTTRANANEAQPGTTVLNRRKQKAVAKAAMMKAIENAEIICTDYIRNWDKIYENPNKLPVSIHEIDITIEVLKGIRNGINAKMNY